MIRAPVVMTMLSLVGAPIGPVACLIWCGTNVHAESTTGDSCHSGSRSLPLSMTILGDSCEDSRPITPFVREESRWDSSLAAGPQPLGTTEQAALEVLRGSTAPMIGADARSIHEPPPLVLRL